MESYALHRMNSYSDILSVKERLGEEKFNDIRDRMYRDLMYLDVSNFYPLDVTWADVDVETKVRVCCLFISENKDCSYVMSNDFKRIIHKYKYEQNANSINDFSDNAIRFRAGSFYNRPTRYVQPTETTDSSK